MKIKLISDTHHEFHEDERLYFNNDQTDVLVVAGDLAVGFTKVFYALKRFAEYHPHVVYVPGNHEYYGSSIHTFDTGLANLVQSYPNIHVLNPGTAKIGDVTFIGATLWTNFSERILSAMHCATSVNDFYQIRGFSVKECAKLYYKHFAYIKHAYENTEGRIVVVTHFLPDRCCISPQYQGSGVLNDYFANNLGSWIADMKNVPYWLFGHTHDNVDKMIGDTNVIANPYGYHENNAYETKVIEL
jgi:predicted phosphodiesterase